MTKKTKKEMFNAIICALSPDCENICSTEEIFDFCHKEMEALDRKAEKAKERSAKKRVEGDKLLDAVFEVLTEDFQPIADITAAVDMEDITASKVSYRLNALVKEGRAQKKEMSIPAAEGGKARRVQSYALA